MQGDFLKNHFLFRWSSEHTNCTQLFGFWPFLGVFHVSLYMLFRPKIGKNSTPVWDWSFLGRFFRDFGRFQIDWVSLVFWGTCWNIDFSESQILSVLESTRGRPSSRIRHGEAGFRRSSGQKISSGEIRTKFLADPRTGKCTQDRDNFSGPRIRSDRNYPNSCFKRNGSGWFVNITVLGPKNSAA